MGYLVNLEATRSSNGTVSRWMLQSLLSACAHALPMRIAAANHARRTCGSDGVNVPGYMNPVRNRCPWKGTMKNAKKRLAIRCKWPIISLMLLETAAGTPAP